MSLKNNTYFGEWLSNAGRRYKYIEKKDSPLQFTKWIYKECGIGKQTIYNYINLYKLMCVAPKLCGCRANMTYFIKNYKILMTYFENEDRCLGNTKLVVNVVIVILTFLEWNFNLNHDLITEPILCNFLADI